MCKLKEKYLLLLLVQFLVFGCSSGDLGYHEKIGIPSAKDIKLYEDSIARIVNGSPSDLGSFYYQAGLLITLTSGWQSVCGGTLVSSTRVLTAARCWWDGRLQARLFTVVLGSLTLFSGGTRVETSDVQTHLDWHPPGELFDIAMVKMPAVGFTNNIYTVSLPALNDAVDVAGYTGIVSGYGKTSDAQSVIPAQAILHHIELSIISNSECQQSTSGIIHGSHLCTSGDTGAGPCDGDAGAPLTVVRNGARILVGLASFGLGRGCESGHPAVFTRVTAHLSWIRTNM